VIGRSACFIGARSKSEGPRAQFKRMERVGVPSVVILSFGAEYPYLSNRLERQGFTAFGVIAVISSDTKNLQNWT
jgi:hypothetical protein